MSDVGQRERKTQVLHGLKQAAAIGEGRSLYDANRDVYNLLRYGVKVWRAVGERIRTVPLDSCLGGVCTGTS